MEDEKQESTNEALLREIREDYTRFEAWWQTHRQERATDMRYISGDPWEPEERRIREDKDNRRPCVNHDELNQYVNQAINNVRQNPRGIKVAPAGNGATEKTAELRQDLIRTIEYESQAQQAYINTFECQLQGSYGFARVGRKYVSNDFTKRDKTAFNQKITISAILDPDSVLFDPDCKTPDWSDGRKCFVIKKIDRREFKRLYPKAKIQDFTAENFRQAPGWISEDKILIAEYIRLESEYRNLYLLKNGKVTDELPKGEEPELEREVEEITVRQYVTNGVEILKKTEHPGDILPIIPCIGKMLYMGGPGEAELKILSLVRLARDPQMSLAYLCSQEMEEAGMTPKVPVIGYVGQFETDADAWETINRVPHSYLQVDPTPDPQNPGQVLPLPQWRQFVPNFQAFEFAKDGCRRAVQAAVGVSPLPTAAQRDNEKSGIALQRMEAQMTVGSFHFADNYDRFLKLVGRVVESWIPVVYDTERDEALQKADGKSKVIRLNPSETQATDTGEQEIFAIGEDDGDHSITVSAGPSSDSQREAAGDFLETLLKSIETIVQISGPQAAAKLLSLSIKLRQLGPLGDQMAETIDPEQAGQFANMQQQLQQQGAAMQELQGNLQKLLLEKQGKVIDNEYKMQIERMREENQLAIAEVNTKAQDLQQRLQTFADMMAQFHSQAHELGMQAHQQEHEHSIADKQAAVASAQSAQDAQQGSMQSAQDAQQQQAMTPPTGQQ